MKLEIVQENDFPLRGAKDSRWYQIKKALHDLPVGKVLKIDMEEAELPKFIQQNISLWAKQWDCKLSYRKGTGNVSFVWKFTE